jgi:tetratricopeptide (TPR) repeat protein
LPIDRNSVLKNAQLFASRGQFDAAISEWKKLSSESPGDGSIFNSIGELHLKRNVTNDAVAAFMQAANAFRTEGATLKAIATYKKILKIDPARYDVFLHLGDLNAERGLLSSAVQDYLTLGKHYIKSGKSKDALQIYKKIVSQDPTNLDAQQRVAELCLQENMQEEASKVYLQLGRERSAQQRYAEAKEAYQAVLRIDPANSEAAQFIENFKRTAGNPGPLLKTESCAAGGRTKSAEPPNLLAEATRRIADKQFAGAEAILNQLLTQEPGNPEVCQLLAKLHLQRGDLQVALGEYRYLAGAALRAQHYEQAESLIVEFLAIAPNSVPILELYGELCEEKGDVAGALPHYGKAIELLIEHPEPGMPTLHEELLEKVKSLAPEHPIVAKLSALMKGEGLAEAPAAAEPEVSNDMAAVAPQESSGFSWTGVESDDAWRRARKVTPIEDARIVVPEPDPVFPERKPLAQAGEFSWSNTEPDQLWGAAAQAAGPSASGPSILSMHEQFQVYIKAGQQIEAEVWLNHLIAAQPNDAEARELFGSLLEAKGDTPGAAVQYSRALELLLAHPNAASPTQTASLYAKVKELAPASSLIAKWASMFSPKPQATVSAVEKPISDSQVNGINSETHYTLGVAYKNMGLLEEAKEEFSLSMKSQNYFSDSCFMIAVCLKEQGQCQSASTQFELMLKDPKCQGTKAQAARYELGLLYEVQELWSQAAEIYESIPTFHDVPKRLESIRGQSASSVPFPTRRYGS